MTTDRAGETVFRSTNGSSPHRTDDQPGDRRRRALSVHPGKLMLPVLLALGVIFILRYFEQSTAAG